jgi:hypothetical protein
MLRLVEVCDSIKSPLAPLFEKGGMLTLCLAHCGYRCAEPTSGRHEFPLDKGGQGDLLKRQIGTYF